MKEQIQDYKLPGQINLALFIATLFASLMIRFDPPIWMGYGDPWDYLNQSHFSWTDLNFYMPVKTENFYPRPFTVPLFYKIAGSNPDLIILLQKFVHALSIFLFCSVLLSYFKRLWIKIFFLFSFYLFMLWWNILGWTNTLLSESLSISLLFVWFASFLLFIKRRTLFLFVVHAVTTILFSFTKDNWPYLLLIFYLLYSLLVLKWDRRLLFPCVGFFIISVSVFFSQQYTAKIGQRYRLPILNNIVFRILPNDNYLQWFEASGMPCAKILKEKYANLQSPSDIYPLYNDSSFVALFDWVAEKGQREYMKFLIAHPSQLFLLHEKTEELDKIVMHDFGYIGEMPEASSLSSRLFPFFNLISVIFLLGMFIFLSIKDKTSLWIFPFVVIIAFGWNALLVYNADALEIERHSLFTNILIQFTGIYMTCFICDSESLNRLMRQVPFKLRSLLARDIIPKKPR